MEVPSKELAKREMAAAEAEMPFHLKEWAAVERWLGWNKYVIALSMLVTPEDEARSVMEGRMRMCEDLIRMGQSARKRID